MQPCRSQSRDSSCPGTIHSLVNSSRLSKHVDYNSLPSYEHPRACPAVQQHPRPNNVSVAIQVPTHIVGAIGEVFLSVAGPEYAYTQAPPGMKSILQAVSMSTLAASFALSLEVSPALKDPHVTIVYSMLAGVMISCAAIFGVCFWKTR